MKNTLKIAISLSLCVSLFPQWGWAAQYDEEIQKQTQEIAKDTAKAAADPSWRKFVGGDYSFRGHYYSYQKNYAAAISDMKSAMQWRQDISDYLDLADYYIAIKDSHSAFSTLERAISRFSGEAQQKAYLKRATIYQNQGENEKALEDLNQLFYSGNVEGIFARGKLFQKLKRNEDAISDYRTVVEKKSNYYSSWAAQSLAELLDSLDREQEALQAYNDYVRLNPSSIGSRASFYEKHDRLADALDDRKEAVAYYRRELANGKEQYMKNSYKSSLGSALGYRADLYMKMNKPEMALVDLNELVDLDPNYYYNVQKRYNFFKKQGRLEEALRDLNQMVRMKPQDGLSARANFYAEQNKDELALDDYSQVIRQAQMTVSSAEDDKKKNAFEELKNAYSSRAGYYVQKGDYNAALADKNEALKAQEKLLEYVQPDSKLSAMDDLSKSHSYRADTYHELKKFQEELEDRNEAVRIAQKVFDQSTAEQKNDNFWVKSNLTYQLSSLAQLKLEQNNYEGGLEDIKRLMAIDETAFSTRAAFYEKAKKLDLAEADFIANVEAARKTFSSPPKPKNDYDDPVSSARSSFISALDSLASFYKRIEKSDKALDAYNDILALDARNLDANYNKATLLAKLGQTERATAAYEEVAANKSKSGYDLKKIGEANLFLKRYDKALNALNKSVEYSDYNDTLLLRARTYMALGDTAMAKQDLNKVVSKINKQKKQYDSDKKLLVEAQGYMKSLGMKVAVAPQSGGAKPQIVKIVPKTGGKVPVASSINQPIKDKWALVIGISKFKKPGHDLKCAAKDAEDFYKYLVNEAGFKNDHVCLLLNEKATRENIMTAFGSKFLPSVSMPGDLVVIFISTHGTPADKDNAQHNYIVAYDTDPTNLYPTGVDMDDLYARIKDGVNTDRALIVMDTCYSGAGLPTKGLGEQANFDAAQVAQGCGRLVITSSANDEKSYESGQSGNGVFTKYFLQALRQGGLIDVKKAFEIAKSKVSWEVKNTWNKSQVPQLGGEWEGKEMILSAPTTEARKVFNVPFAAPQMAAPQAVSKSIQQRKRKPGGVTKSVPNTLPKKK